MLINTFDIDGVIYFDNGFRGVRPHRYDFIVTGRSIDEEPETSKWLIQNEIENKVFYNPVPFDEKSREKSALHKAKTIHEIRYNMMYNHGIHFEDDPVQIEIIQREIPWVKIIHVNSNGFVELENRRRT